MQKTLDVTIDSSKLSKGLRAFKETSRNTSLLVQCNGAVGRDKVLSILDNMSRIITGTSSVGEVIRTETWSCVAMSATGQYIAAITTYTPPALSVYAYSNNYGLTWSYTNFASWPGCSLLYMSRDGQYMGRMGRSSSSYPYERGYFSSQDFGATFHEVATGTFDVDCSKYVLSDDGKYQGVYDNYLGLASSDFGVTFTSKGYFGAEPVASSDFHYVYSKMSPVIVSTDFGVTYINRGYTMQHGACDETGNFLYLLNVSGAYNRIVYLSTNYGVSYSPIYTFTSPISGAPWEAIKVSRNGVYKCAIVGGSVCIGVGEVWAPATVDRTHHAMYGEDSIVLKGSDDSQYLLSAHKIADQPIYYSHDYGDTWAVSNAPVTSYRTMVTSANGRYCATVKWNTSSPIMLSSDYGVTWSDHFAEIGSPCGMDDNFPFPQIFVFAHHTIFCCSTKICEYVGGSLTLKYTVSSASNRMWSAVDYYNYIYLTNGTVVIIRNPLTGEYALSTDGLPPAVAACNFNGQMVISV